jgi:hypothetical protein
MNAPPFLAGFDPAQIWPTESYQALLESARSGEATMLGGVPGAGFAAAVWVLHRAQPRGETIQQVDLSRLSNLERLRAWASPSPAHGLDWVEHAELIPPARRATGAQRGRVASFVTTETSSPELFEAWRLVRVPSLSQLLRLENAVQTAWRSLTGKGLPKRLATELVHHCYPYDVEDLERAMVEAAPQGVEYLSQRLESGLGLCFGPSQWKKRKRLLEKTLLEEALKKSGGNKTRAAQALGVHRNTVLWHLRKMREVKKQAKG